MGKKLKEGLRVTYSEWLNTHSHMIAAEATGIPASKLRSFVTRGSLNDHDYEKLFAFLNGTEAQGAPAMVKEIPPNYNDPLAGFANQLNSLAGFIVNPDNGSPATRARYAFTQLLALHDAMKDRWETINNGEKRSD